jgi:hypothetical protein
MDRKQREIFELMVGWEEELANENIDETDFNSFPRGWAILNLQNKIDLLKNLKGYNDNSSDGIISKKSIDKGNE